jgi:hypothetical protein
MRLKLILLIIFLLILLFKGILSIFIHIWSDQNRFSVINIKIEFTLLIIFCLRRIEVVDFIDCDFTAFCHWRKFTLILINFIWGIYHAFHHMAIIWIINFIDSDFGLIFIITGGISILCEGWFGLIHNTFSHIIFIINFSDCDWSGFWSFIDWFIIIHYSRNNYFGGSFILEGGRFGIILNRFFLSSGLVLLSLDQDGLSILISHSFFI